MGIDEKHASDHDEGHELAKRVDSNPYEELSPRPSDVDFPFSSTMPRTKA